MKSSARCETGRETAQVAGATDAPANVVRAFFHGHPASQGSKSRNRYGGMYESAKGWRAWRRAVAQQCLVVRSQNPRITFPLSGPLKIEYDFRFLRPRRPRHSFPPIDYDKIARSTGDALVAGGVLLDDRFIVRAEIVKRYAAAGSPCGVFVRIVAPWEVDA